MAYPKIYTETRKDTGYQNTNLFNPILDEYEEKRVEKNCVCGESDRNKFYKRQNICIRCHYERTRVIKGYKKRIK